MTTIEGRADHRGVRIVSAGELRAAVGMEDLIEPVSRAFQESSAGLADNGLVVMFPAERPDLGDVYVKTGVVRGHAVYIVKVAPWFAANRERGQAQGGFIGVFDSQTGHTLALLDDQHYLSDIRTAAAGAVAARVCAPAVVRTAAILGAGTQAYWQARALYHERPFARLEVWARDSEKAAALKARLEPVLPEVEIGVSTDLEGVVRRADALMTTTQARDPLVSGAWLHEGQHITAVGADDATKCELDTIVLQRSRTLVDSRQALSASGDIQRAIAAGAYTGADIAGELGEALAGQLPGRVSQRDITLVKLVGIGAQDLAAAEVALEKLGIWPAR